MKFKLYKEENPALSPTQQILYNRGIELKDQEKWLKAGKNELNSWKDFGPEMKLALKNLKEHIDNNDEVHIVVDCD